jgi:hypothetical protein
MTIHNPGESSSDHIFNRQLAINSIITNSLPLSEGFLNLKFFLEILLFNAI